MSPSSVCPPSSFKRTTAPLSSSDVDISPSFALLTVSRHVLISAFRIAASRIFRACCSASAVVTVSVATTIACSRSSSEITPSSVGISHGRPCLSSASAASKIRRQNGIVNHSALSPESLAFVSPLMIAPQNSRSEISLVRLWYGSSITHPSLAVRRLVRPCVASLFLLAKNALDIPPTSAFFCRSLSFVYGFQQVFSSVFSPESVHRVKVARSTGG